MGIEQAFCLGIAAGGGAERKQAGTITAIAADRNPGPHDDAKTVAQGVQSLDRRVCGAHQAEGVALKLDLTGLQSRPGGDAGAD